MKKILLFSMVGVLILILGGMGWTQENAPADVVSLMDTVLTKMTQMVQPNTLIGSPISVGNVTVVPVIKVDVGFGGGGGLGMPAGVPSGGGTGGGITMELVSFLVIQEGKVTLLSATTPVSPWKDIIELVLPMIMQGMSGMSGMSGGSDMSGMMEDISPDMSEPMASPTPGE